MRFHELRQAESLSQCEVASSAGLTQGYYSALECGNRQNPSIGLLVKLAKALNCRISDLFDDDDGGEQVQDTA
ncbi:hypothetical protein FACS1894184_04790 [Clostridia bacterium]|nr:hypothetical protein FACS1894184_04790 [Clostridia bacterium]